MLLESYRINIFRPECNPRFSSLHCVAQLDQDVACALPYLNAVLGGDQYLNDPPEVMFHHHGRIIKVAAREIAVNALKDQDEAERILSWLKDEINRAWEDRESISPSCEARAKPKLINILQLLPKTNCKKCGQATCMVFAAQLVEGGRRAADCPDLDDDKRTALEDYLTRFVFD
jgi:ArsR family metal-binding transcriptional regulator